MIDYETYCRIRVLRLERGLTSSQIGRELGIEAGDLLAVVSAGAYGAVMSSNYNTRPRAPEVMVDGDRVHLVRRRETAAELHAAESTLPR